MALFRTKRAFQNAVIGNDTLTIADYLKKSADWLQTTDRNGNTPLQLAINAGAVESFNMLLPRRKEMDGAVHRLNETALHTAVRAGQTEMVRTLIALPEYLATLNKADREGHTPLRLAIDNGHEDILKIFLATGKADLGGAQPAVYRAILANQPGSLRTLIEAGADVNAPFIVPPDYRHSLFSSWEDRQEKRYSALGLAVKNNKSEMVQMLLDAGAKPQEKETLLCAAAGHGNVEVITALLAYGHSIHETLNDRMTPLHLAAQKGHVPAVALLLDNGANRTKLDDQKRTALSYAQQFANKELVDLLQEEAPVRPTQVVVAAKPLVKKPSPLPVPQPARPIEAQLPATDSETWKRLGAQNVAHISDFPSVQRKLTEIFNFETRERITISENLATRVETTTPGESFDNISEDALGKAVTEFTRLGGKVDASQVFRGRITKAKYNPK